MKKDKNGMQVVSIRLEPPIFKKLEDIGTREDRKISYLVRKAVHLYVENYGRKS
jgi:predicted transcriptional regulator